MTIKETLAAAAKEQTAVEYYVNVGTLENQCSVGDGYIDLGDDKGNLIDCSTRGLFLRRGAEIAAGSIKKVKGSYFSCENLILKLELTEAQVAYLREEWGLEVEPVDSF